MDYLSYVDSLRRYYHRQLMNQIDILSVDYGLGFVEIAEVCEITPAVLRRIVRFNFKMSVVRLMYMSHLICEYRKNNSSVVV